MRMAVHRRRRGVAPPLDPPLSTKVTTLGEKRNLQSGKSGRATFSPQLFGRAIWVIIVEQQGLYPV